MPITIRQCVAQINSDLKSTMDTRLSPKYIWTKFMFNLANLLKQVNESKRVWKSSDSWYKIKCIDMKVIPAADCCDIFPLINEYMSRSVHKLPATYTSAAGDMIRDISAIFPYGKEYILTTPKEYNKIRKREFKDPRIGYAFIIDGYLYIPDSEVEKVSVSLCPVNPKEAAVLNGDDPCKPYLDYNVYMPEYLIKATHDLVLQDIAGVNLKVVKDEKPDMNENSKS